MEVKDIVVAIISVIAIIWGGISFFLLHKQNKDSEVFKKKLEIFHKYIKGEFGSDKTNSGELYSEVGLIGSLSTLETIIKLKGLDPEKDSMEWTQAELLSSIRKELDPELSDDLYTLKQYVNFLSGGAPNKKEVISVGSLKFLTFSNLFSPVRGAYIPQTNLIEVNEKEPGFNYIRIRDIQDSGKISLNKKFKIIPEFEGKICPHEILKEGIFLLSKVGTIGKLGFLSLEDTDSQIIISDNIFSFYLNEKINMICSTKYIEIVFKTDYIKKQLDGITHGSAQQFISHNEISNLSIPILTIEEQRKIIELNRDIAITELDKKLNVIPE